MSREQVSTRQVDEQIAAALFTDLCSAEIRDILPLGMVARRMAIAMWYGRGSITLGTYDAAEDVLAGQDLTAQEAVTFLAPEGTPADRIDRVASALSSIIADDILANGEKYEEERRDTADRIFKLPLSDADVPRMRQLLESSGGVNTDTTLDSFRRFKG